MSGGSDSLENLFQVNFYSKPFIGADCIKRRSCELNRESQLSVLFGTQAQKKWKATIGHIWKTKPWFLYIQGPCGGHVLLIYSSAGAVTLRRRRGWHRGGPRRRRWHSSRWGRFYSGCGSTRTGSSASSSSPWRWRPASFWYSSPGPTSTNSTYYGAG